MLYNSNNINNSNTEKMATENKMATTINTPNPQFMEKLEKDGETKTKALISSTNISNQQFEDGLKKILSDGEEEFKQKNGRQMTYGEMRELYG